MKTRLSIDWISATDHSTGLTPKYTAHPVLHDWENWEAVNGANGYTSGAKHQSGAKVYQNLTRLDMGKHIIYSGKTLQRVNKMYNINSVEILRHHIESGHNIARLDIAIDFFGEGVTVADFQNSFLSGQAVTKLRSASVIKSLTSAGHTFYIGSKKKRKKLVRIYDKSAEQNWDFPCVRLEVQIMGKPATKVSLQSLKSDNMGKTLMGAIKDIIDFPMIMPFAHAMAYADDIQIGTVCDQLGDTKKWLQEAVRMCLIRQAVLDLNWWTQYKLDIDLQLERRDEKNWV